MRSEREEERGDVAVEVRKSFRFSGETYHGLWFLQRASLPVGSFRRILIFLRGESRGDFIEAGRANDSAWLDTTLLVSTHRVECVRMNSSSLNFWAF